jgi:hypothetical protein
LQLTLESPITPGLIVRTRTIVGYQMFFYKVIITLPEKNSMRVWCLGEGPYPFL